MEGGLLDYSSNGAFTWDYKWCRAATVVGCDFDKANDRIEQQALLQDAEYLDLAVCGGVCR